MVFDRQGHFVPDLKRDQFELRVDGKKQPIEFIELVSAGSSHDREIWAKTEGQPAPESDQLAAKDSNPGRTLLIFLDDWHMAADNTMRSRTAVANLLNTSMGSNDRVGIFSASGQLAAMQSLTNDKAALLALLEKYHFQSPGVQDLGSPPMTEAQAISIEQNDEGVLGYFIGAILGMPVEYNRGTCKPLGAMMSAGFGSSCRLAAEQTRRRAVALAEISAAIGSRTLSALGQLLHSADGLPGRKLVFFLSDGFVLQYGRSDIVARLTDLTTAAAREGILVYTLDSRGLVTGTPDAKADAAPDETGVRTHMAANEVSAPWDVLNALAADTGGRFLKNTNALDTALITALTEISRYYLLGWALDPEKVLPGKFSGINVTVKGRPDLSVRVRQGFLDLSRLVSIAENKGKTELPVNAAPPTMMEIYAKARSVVDLNAEELRRAYPTEMSDLIFTENQDGLDLLLHKVGESVGIFFRDFPNTASKEKVRLERLLNDGRVDERLDQSFNYIIEISTDGTGVHAQEFRTDSRGRPLQRERLKGLSVLTSGFATAGIISFYPNLQSTSRMRYLGRQISEPNAHVIAFAQKLTPEALAGSFQLEGMPPTPLFYQGMVWVDPQSYQIVRMRTDLLAPRNDVGLAQQTSEIWFSEVHFNSVSHPFWLSREVVVTHKWQGVTLRNRHQYSDYSVFLVESRDKLELLKIKKSP